MKNKNELDTLPESVRKALDMLPSMACTSDEEDAVGVLRAALLRYREMVSDRSREMLRLVRESGELKTRAEKAESERDALKARIAEAPKVTLALANGDDLVILSAERAEAWAGKTCALLPLDDESKS